jgi:uncharacterized protein involved in tellurium resistance
MGDFATTRWLDFGLVDLSLAAVLRDGLLWRLDEEPALAGIFKSAGIDHGLGLLNKVVEGLESSIDAGEAHVGHLIEAAEALGDQFADDLAGDFLVVVAIDLVFDFVRYPL